MLARENHSPNLVKQYTMKLDDLLHLANGRNPHHKKVSFCTIHACIGIVWNNRIPACFRDSSQAPQTAQQIRLAVRSVYNGGAITALESGLAQEVLEEITD
jgi:hypothetical protein